MKYEWPKDARCAVLISVEYDAESVEWGYWGSISGAFDMGSFAHQFALPRVLEIFRKYDIPATFFVPAWDAERKPDLLRGIAAHGHEIAAHGYLHEDLSQFELQDERETLQKAHDILANITGEPPRGFRSGAYARPISPHTLSLCRQLGYLYDSSFMDSDWPYLLSVEDGQPDMVEIPWTWPLNDISFFGPVMSAGLSYVLPPRTPEWVLAFWRDEFDSLYKEVGFFNLIIHLRDIGRVSRLPVLEALLDHMHGNSGVWFATHQQLASYILENVSL